MFEQVKIILINTTHPGNIGATARAMKNMGFGKLCLVSPKLFPSPEATARASGAEDLLDKAEVVASLEEAIVGCHWVVGLSARARRLNWPNLTVREAAGELAKTLQSDKAIKVGILFGQEQSGLLNEELAKCHYQITIPADPRYASLNLAQAVQIMVYELHMALVNLSAVKEALATAEEISMTEDLATAEEVEGFYEHWQAALVDIGFLNLEQPGHLMRHLRRLYGRVHLTKTELNIMRGILTTVQKGV